MSCGHGQRQVWWQFPDSFPEVKGVSPESTPNRTLIGRCRSGVGPWGQSQVAMMIGPSGSHAHPCKKVGGWNSLAAPVKTKGLKPVKEHYPSQKGLFIIHGGMEADRIDRFPMPFCIQLSSLWEQIWEIIEILDKSKDEDSGTEASRY
jgi:hypothetical protein